MQKINRKGSLCSTWEKPLSATHRPACTGSHEGQPVCRLPYVRSHSASSPRCLQSDSVPVRKSLGLGRYIDCSQPSSSQEAEQSSPQPASQRPGAQGGVDLKCKGRPLVLGRGPLFQAAVGGALSTGGRAGLANGQHQGCSLRAACRAPGGCFCKKGKVHRFNIIIHLFI